MTTVGQGVGIQFRRLVRQVRVVRGLQSALVDERHVIASRLLVTEDKIRIRREQLKPYPGVVERLVRPYPGIETAYTVERDSKTPMDPAERRSRLDQIVEEVREMERLVEKLKDEMCAIDEQIADLQPDLSALDGLVRRISNDGRLVHEDVPQTNNLSLAGPRALTFGGER